MIVDTMKFVYFDIGGVLMKDLSDNDEGWQFLLFNKFGLNKNQLKEFHKFFETFEKELDLGRGIKEFPIMMKSNFGVNLPKNYLLTDELVSGFFCRNEGLIEIIEKIKNKYKLGLLTNMYDGMLDLIKKNNLIPDIDWRVIVDSSVEKCRKPERKIYEIAQKKSGFKGNEILFIDNKKENLEIPKKNGWQTYWYDSSDYDKSNQELAKILR